mmetsp:Transcript_21972/g.51509  ORF Transcript_21972/g.51509 Transcript_21972/m.51509 type:complete len:433 (+) Transcript_21972:83-1381(+)
MFLPGDLARAPVVLEHIPVVGAGVDVAVPTAAADKDTAAAALVHGDGCRRVGYSVPHHVSGHTGVVVDLVVVPTAGWPVDRHCLRAISASHVLVQSDAGAATAVGVVRLAAVGRQQVRVQVARDRPPSEHNAQLVAAQSGRHVNIKARVRPRDGHTILEGAEASAGDLDNPSARGHSGDVVAAATNHPTLDNTALCCSNRGRTGPVATGDGILNFTTQVVGAGGPAHCLRPAARRHAAPLDGVPPGGGVVDSEAELRGLEVNVEAGARLRRVRVGAGHGVVRVAPDIAEVDGGSSEATAASVDADFDTVAVVVLPTVGLGAAAHLSRVGPCATIVEHPGTVARVLWPAAHTPRRTDSAPPELVAVCSCSRRVGAINVHTELSSVGRIHGPDTSAQNSPGRGQGRHNLGGCSETAAPHVDIRVHVSAVAAPAR